LHRKDFIDTSYVRGVIGVDGEMAIRPLNESEAEWLNNYYKEAIHGTFKTDDESKLLFKRAKHLSTKRENVEFFQTHGFYPDDVNKAVEAFDTKSKTLGNMLYSFWDQRDINSDDYKRKGDIHCNASKGFQLDSFEDMQYTEQVDESDDTRIEDLITESEE
jgi:hypothetical protein